MLRIRTVKDIVIIRAAASNDIISKGKWPFLSQHKVANSGLCILLLYQIWLRQYAQGLLSSLVIIFSKCENFLGGNINITGKDSEDDGAIIFDVPLNHVLDKSNIIFGRDSLGRVMKDARNVNDC